MLNPNSTLRFITYLDSGTLLNLNIRQESLRQQVRTLRDLNKVLPKDSWGFARNERVMEALKGDIARIRRLKKCHYCGLREFKRINPKATPAMIEKCALNGADDILLKQDALLFIKRNSLIIGMGVSALTVGWAW